MIDDPIVASARAVREELAAECGYDVHAIFADMRARQSQFGERLVQPPVLHKPPLLASADDSLGVATQSVAFP